MALGVTQQLPAEERHSYSQDYLEESHRRSPWVAASPRSSCSAWCRTGANNDLVGRHRAGPQDGARVGHEHAHRARWPGARRARCSSATTSCTPATTATTPPASSTKRSSASCASRRTQCREVLTENRKGLDLVARALLEYETIDGAEVTRLIELSQRRRGREGRRAPAARGGRRRNGHDSQRPHRRPDARLTTGRRRIG